MLVRTSYVELVVLHLVQSVDHIVRFGAYGVLKC
jgi:hypothetical protein